MQIADDPRQPWCLRQFLKHTPSRDHEAPRLFATHGTRRVRVVRARPTGRVDITENLSGGLSQKTVGIKELRDIMPTPYPLRRRAPRAAPIDVTPPTCGAEDHARAGAAVLERAAADCGTDVETMLSESIQPRDTAARRIAACRLYVSGTRTMREIGVLLNRPTEAVRSIIEATGLLGDEISGFDQNYLRAIWVRDSLPIGYGAGEVPREVANRLVGFTRVADGRITAAAVARAQSKESTP
ncbi:MAG: hypothetical protein ACAH27_05985 [Xanthobacteraceae bacterium]